MELAPESVLVVSGEVVLAELESEPVLVSVVVLASELGAAVESGAGEESVLAIDPTSGIWSANGTWSAAKAPAAPTATTESAIANVAALRPCRDGGEAVGDALERSFWSDSRGPDVERRPFGDAHTLVRGVDDAELELAPLVDDRRVLAGGADDAQARGCGGPRACAREGRPGK